VTAVQRQLLQVASGHSFSPTPSTASTLRVAVSETELHPTGLHEVAAFHQDSSKNRNKNNLF